jgi:hypothetical protein
MTSTHDLDFVFDASFKGLRFDPCFPSIRRSPVNYLVRRTASADSSHSKPRHRCACLRRGRRTQIHAGSHATIFFNNVNSGGFPSSTLTRPCISHVDARNKTVAAMQLRTAIVIRPALCSPNRAEKGPQCERVGPGPVSGTGVVGEPDRESFAARATSLDQNRAVKRSSSSSRSFRDIKPQLSTSSWNLTAPARIKSFRNSSSV